MLKTIFLGWKIQQSMDLSFKNTKSYLYLSHSLVCSYRLQHVELQIFIRIHTI